MQSEDQKTTAAQALRQIAQAVATLDKATPQVDVGDLDAISAAEEALGLEMPAELRQLYLDSNPVSLTLPLPEEDIEFAPIAEFEIVQDEFGSPEGYLVFAREGDTPIAVPTNDSEGGVVVGLGEEGAWEWERVSESVADFLAALAKIAEAFAGSVADDLASRFELSPEGLVGLEDDLAAIDGEYVDRWMEWIG